MIAWSRLGKRHDAFKALAAELPEGCVIVETGTVRQVDNWEGDGQSTLVWNHLAADRNGSVITIDINPAGAQLVTDLELDHVTALTGDSLTILPTLTGPINLLYLDSFDINFEHPQPAADHHLAELFAAQHLLQSGSIVAVDDNYDDAGKGSEVASYFERHGVVEIITGYVRAWRIP